jgi:hypothetical protein
MLGGFVSGETVGGYWFEWRICAEGRIAEIVPKLQVRSGEEREKRMR